MACGAIAQPAAQVAARNGWPVDVHPLPPLLHNQPHLIADEVRRLATALSGDYAGVAVGYADCGTYGALDAVCEELGLRRLPGLHCYDLYDGEETLAARLEAEPGTYLLTDFLVRSFERTVGAAVGVAHRDACVLAGQRGRQAAYLVGDQLRTVVQQRRQGMHVDGPVVAGDDGGRGLGDRAAGDQGHARAPVRSGRRGGRRSGR